MPRFLAIGYGDRAGYDRTPAPLRKAAHARDAALVEAGAIMGVAGAPVQVRNPGGGRVETREGPYMASALPVAGVTLIEAESLDAAIGQLSGTPCAVADGVVEIWPLG